VARATVEDLALRERGSIAYALTAVRRAALLTEPIISYKQWALSFGVS
jgi:hypothetical protein